MRLAVALVAALVPAAPAAASEPPTAEITATQPLGRFAGVPYERVTGTLAGTATADEPVVGLTAAQPYRSAFELVRPVRGGARVVVVEAENRGTAVLLRSLGTRFLPPRGVAHVRARWQTGLAEGVPATAQGVGQVIVRDLGRLLARGGALGPAIPRRVLAGASQSAWFVNAFVAEGFNRDPATGRGVFTAALTVNGAGNWLAVNGLACDGEEQDAYLRPQRRPLMPAQLLRRPASDPFLVDVAAYTDFYRVRAGLTPRRLPARMRRLDLPAPHQSFGPDVVFGGLGCNGRQEVPLSPLRSAPYLRAVVARLAAGRPLPSRRFVPGRAPRTSPLFNGLPGVAVRVPAVDRDGQPVGGVRFPEVDLPLGRLTPVSLPPVVTTTSGAVCGNSGGFTPFASPAVRRRYGSVARYVTRHRTALDRLVRAGYVLREDRRALLADARRAYLRAAR